MCENNKRLGRHVIYCMQCLRIKRNNFKNQRKFDKQKIQLFLAVCLFAVIRHTLELFPQL